MSAISPQFKLAAASALWGAAVLENAVETGQLFGRDVRAELGVPSKELGELGALARAVGILLTAADRKMRGCDLGLAGGDGIVALAEALNVFEDATGWKTWINVSRQGYAVHGLGSFFSKITGAAKSVAKGVTSAAKSVAKGTASAAKTVARGTASAAKAVARPVSSAAKAVANTASNIANKGVACAKDPSKCYADVKKELASIDPTTAAGREKLSGAMGIFGIILGAPLLSILTGAIGSTIECIKKGGGRWNVLECLGKFLADTFKAIISMPEFEVLIGFFMGQPVMMMHGALRLLQKDLALAMGKDSKTGAYVTAGLNVCLDSSDIFASIAAQGPNAFKSPAMYATFGDALARALPKTGRSLGSLGAAPDGVAALGKFMTENCASLSRMTSDPQKAFAEIKDRFIDPTSGKLRPTVDVNGLAEAAAGVDAIGVFFDKISLAHQRDSWLARVAQKALAPFGHLGKFFHDTAKSIRALVDMAKRGQKILTSASPAQGAAALVAAQQTAANKMPAVTAATTARADAGLKAASAQYQAQQAAAPAAPSTATPPPSAKAGGSGVIVAAAAAAGALLLLR